MTVLVLGGAGMLGHKVLQRLASDGHTVACTIRGSVAEAPYCRISLFREHETLERVEVSDLASLGALLRARKPDAIVNCIGVIKQRPSAHDAVPSILVNSLLPHQLADWAAEWGGRVVHFSTDCVFDGARGRYTEEDRPNAVDLYGKSKHLGEVAAPNAVTLRTSIIGRELSQFASLVEWFIAQEGKTVRGYTKALYSGMTTQTMAGLVSGILSRHPDMSGLYHAVSETIDKYNLLLLLRQEFKIGVEVEPFDEFECDRSMADGRLEAVTGWRAPTWPQQIREMADDPTPYMSWR